MGSHVPVRCLDRLISSACHFAAIHCTRIAVLLMHIDDTRVSLFYAISEWASSEKSLLTFGATNLVGAASIATVPNLSVVCDISSPCI